MKKVLVLAVLGLPMVQPLPVIPAAAQAVAIEETVIFAVDNMTCALCPVTVKRAMEGVEGVRSVDIDFESRAATVVFDTGVTSAEAIAAASANAGYPAFSGG